MDRPSPRPGDAPWPPARPLWLQHAPWDRRGAERGVGAANQTDVVADSLCEAETLVCDVAPQHVRVSAEDPSLVDWRAVTPDDSAAADALIWLGGIPARLIRLHEPPAAERARELRWMPWRKAALMLGPDDAEAMAVGMAVGRWHATHRCCARCGAATLIAGGGWLRRCPECAAEHYPRTDPVVIMAVLDDAGRICLARGHQFFSPVGMSCPAGFVDAAESLEDAVRREVREELGLTVTSVSYAGSQPWPPAAQLMVAMVARVADPEALCIDPEEVDVARWFSRDELRAELAAGRLTLPATYAAGRWLVEGWLGEALPDSVSSVYTRAPH